MKRVMDQKAFDRPLHVVHGIPLDSVGLEGAMAVIDRAIAARKPLLLSTPNMNFYTLAQHDAAFRQSLFASGLCLADGAPVVALARLAGVPLPGRVAGSDLFEALRDRRTAAPIKVYLFGGPQGAAEKAAAALNASAKGVICVGWASPGFGTIAEMSTDAILSKINASGADMLVIALGAQKGQAWLMHNAGRLTVPVRTHLGAVVNFEAGTVARAPALYRKLALEWLWRIRQEPRLAARYRDDALTLARLFTTRSLPGFLSRPRDNDALPDRIRAALTSGMLDCTGLGRLSTGDLGQIAELKRRMGPSLLMQNVAPALEHCLTINGLWP
ncbi:WecB/TagA/CpsF family glycosyltransferase [Aestuariivirga sp.]|uniref:WecB/TagA/CpsF family glycosyltransferase n=1 Tax=Aestuariivirga sp. TaxID=2650926 RepID=UPI0039E4F8B8